MLTYKFRLYPNQEQQEKLWRHANKLNWLYNQFLDLKIKTYQNENKSLSRYDLQKLIPDFKGNDPVLSEIHSQVVQQVTYRLDETFKHFFRNKYGFPKFRSCRDFFSICYPQSGYYIIDNIFRTKVYGDVTFKKHREILGEISTVTITNKSNKWYLCISVDKEREKEGEGVIGIDIGITNLVATSRGSIIRNKTHAKYFDKHVNSLKSRRDKCKKLSNKFRWLNKVIQRLYDVKNRKTDDFQHKISKNLSSSYDTIIVEDLNVKQMSESNITGLNKEIRNSKLSSFISKLRYKVKNLIEVNPRDTSKTCNRCGKIKAMPLSERKYKCECGYKEDRDVNSAKNIFCLGQAILNKVCTVEDSIQKIFLLGRTYEASSFRER